MKEISQEVVSVRKTKVAFSPLVLYLRAFGTFCLNKRLFFVIHEGVLTNKEVEQISIVGSMLWDIYINILFLLSLSVCTFVGVCHKSASLCVEILRHRKK